MSSLTVIQIQVTLDLIGITCNLTDSCECKSSHDRFLLLGSCHVETSRVRVLEEHAEGRAVRGRPNGGPERAGLEAAEPQTRRRALLHAHAARTGVCEGRKLPPGEPLQRSVPGGQTPHHTGGFT